jgi:hypothetical protein
MTQNEKKVVAEKWFLMAAKNIFQRVFSCVSPVIIVKNPLTEVNMQVNISP